MSEYNIPDWLAKWLSENAFTPSQEFIEKFEPQSRIEALLKYGLLNGPSPEEQFRFMVKVSEGSTTYQPFVDADGKFFCVKHS